MRVPGNKAPASAWGKQSARGTVLTVSGPAGALSEYEKNTDRVFPVIVLEGVPAPA
jgi:hypothetical protein